MSDRATDLENELVAHAVHDRSRLGGLGFVDDHLRQAVPIAQVDEDEAAVVSPAMNPAGQSDLSPGVACAQIPARDVAIGRGKAKRCLGRCGRSVGVTHAAHRTGTSGAVSKTSREWLPGPGHAPWHGRHPVHELPGDGDGDSPSAVGQLPPV